MEMYTQIKKPYNCDVCNKSFRDTFKYIIVQGTLTNVMFVIKRFNNQVKAASQFIREYTHRREDLISKFEQPYICGKKIKFSENCVIFFKLSK